MSSRIYDVVAGNRPALNRFDLSYTNQFSASIGYLYPVQCDEVVPGDVFRMSCYVHAELQPMVAPVMSDLQMYVHAFFVPYRILFGSTSDGKNVWEEYITGGDNGDYDVPLPSWTPSVPVQSTFSSHLIWDYVGNPMSFVSGTGWSPIVPDGLDVSIVPKYAYNKTYNDFYRDEFLQDEISEDNEFLQQVSFRKDYFTSAALAQQLGVSPLVPFSGEMNVKSNWIGDVSSSMKQFVPVQFYDKPHPTFLSNSVYGIVSGWQTPGTVDNYSADGQGGGNASYGIPTGETGPGYSTAGIYYAPGDVLPFKPLGVDTTHMKVSSTGTAGLSITDLRLAFAIQRLQELNMRAGVRYTEWLGAHFGANPTDARLDRPEYIGGCLIPVTINSQVQSSASDSTSPQGNKVGIGKIDSLNKIGNYRVLEYGVIMTFCSIRPKPIYKQGINRQWLRQSRFDYYMPEFAYLSEQAIYNAELYTDSTGDDSGIFGYQAAWNEMRSKNNIVTGAMREQFDYWTLARKFSSRPHLNADFLKIDANDFNKIFAVQDEDTFVISFSNIIDAYRPMPAFGVPGLVDHVYGGR